MLALQESGIHYEVRAAGFRPPLVQPPVRSLHCIRLCSQAGPLLLQ